MGEIFNSLQGEGLCIGKRQVLVRFAGCSCRCVYCDTEAYRNFRLPFCGVQVRAGGAKFRRVPNPLGPDAVAGQVKRLLTPDVHSISLTGGEPLEAGEFLVEVAVACRETGLPLYLETNGADSQRMRRVAPYLDYASIDVKLPDHGAVARSRWSKLFEEELECVRIARSQDLRTFVKIVVLARSDPVVFERVCKRLAKFEIPLVIQPVTPRKNVAAPPIEDLLAFSEIASGAGVSEIAIIPQVQKLIGVR